MSVVNSPVHLSVTYMYRQFGFPVFISGIGCGRVERRCWVNFQCRGVLLVWMTVGQGPIALAVGAGGGLFGHFFISSVFSLFFLPLLGRRPDID